MLSAPQNKNAKLKEKPYKFTDGEGLYLHISPSGDKTWLHRFAITGTESTYALEVCPAMLFID